MTVFESKPMAGKPLRDHAEHRPAEPGRADPGQDQAGRGPGRDPALDRGGASPPPTTPAPRASRWPPSAGRRPAPRSRWSVRSPCSGPGWSPTLVGELPEHRDRGRQGVRELRRLPGERPGHHQPADRAGPVLQHRVHRPARPGQGAGPGRGRRLARGRASTTTSASRSFFGSVPDDPTATGRAAALIGQGKVEASPLAMAGGGRVGQRRADGAAAPGRGRRASPRRRASR